MKTNLDSKSLFFRQVKNHARTLSTLLQAGSSAKVEDSLMEKCIVSTKMLSGSASLLGFGGWEELLTAYECLLIRCRNNETLWDENVAQVTSELIEKEELLVSSQSERSASTKGDTVSVEEVKALLEEMNALLDSKVSNKDGRKTAKKATTSPGKADDKERELPRAKAPHPKLEGGKASRGRGKGALAGDKPLGRLMAQLENSTASLVKEWESLEWKLPQWQQSSVAKIRKQSYLVDFFALSMDQILKVKDEIIPGAIMSSLQPVKLALEDLAGVLSGESGRRVDIAFLGGENSIDIRLLFKIEEILQCLVSDIFLRCDDIYLRIEIEVQEKGGALLWRLRDNGNNFITDSRLDRDDFLAFYPNLREARRLLGKLHGILWVEPNESHDTRFAFTTPLSTKKRRFMVWGKGKGSFGVLSTQLDCVRTRDKVKVEADPRGECLLLDGKWVPLVRLGLLYPEAPEKGGRIAVVGFLEKRMAFYVESGGRLEEGEYLEDAVSVWRGLSQGAAQLENQRIPVIEAEAFFKCYLNALGGTFPGDVSGGGVVENGSSLSQSQATFEKEAEPPPELKCKPGKAKVLVVERSEALRAAFASIFLGWDIEAIMVERVEEAPDILRDLEPDLIISEFRMPSMAAKVLVEELMKKGREIPVLVTTSQEAETASLLVERLGVAGYLTKPLRSEEVITTLQEHLPLERNLAADD